LPSLSRFCTTPVFGKSPEKLVPHERHRTWWLRGLARTGAPDPETSGCGRTERQRVSPSRQRFLRRGPSRLAQPQPLSNEELWRGLLTGEGSPIKHDRARYRRLPGRPRCKTCLVPLGGHAAPLIRLITHRAESRKNPNYCNLCEDFVRTHPGGAEVELSLLFADVRGSTTLAEGMSARDFTQLMNRFYGSANRVLIDSDAIVDKLVGDEVIGLYLPFLGHTHARLAIEAARKLLQATGHEDASGPWLPVGAGVHTGRPTLAPWVRRTRWPTSPLFGDAVNITARLASLAGQGEVLITEAAQDASGLSLDDLEMLDLELKGRTKATRVRVLRVAG